MGSLKDEMRGLREDHQPEETDDGVCTGGPENHKSHESTTQEDYLPKLHMNATKERGKDPASKDQVFTEDECGNAEPSDCERGKHSTQTDGETGATHNDATISVQFVSDGEESKAREEGRDADIQNIVVPVPSTPNLSEPCTPAPFGQQHMRTQVSLEVVQCCSVATSPMTPPEGGHSFFFPTSFGKTGAVAADTKDAELQVGHKVEFCSVATSPIPMTPKTPSATAFPELIERKAEQREESAKQNEEQRETGKPQSSSTTTSSAEVKSEIVAASQVTTLKEEKEGSSSKVSPETKTNCVSSGFIDSQISRKDDDNQCKQPRMGSMDQDITILVTHYVNNDQQEDDDAECSSPSVTIEEKEEEEGECNKQEEKEAEADDHLQEISDKTPLQTKTEEPCVPGDQQPPPGSKSVKSEVDENKGGCEEMRVVSVTKAPIPESPAPFGCHNMRTQVSLEVVQCQSVATSPMTPPEGDQAFYFPSSLGKCTPVGTELKDAGMQMGQQVEFRSVATAPMTPRTPTTTAFPEFKKDTSIKEENVEEEKAEEEDTKKQVNKDRDEELKEKVNATEEKPEVVEEHKKPAVCMDKEEEKEEPVQEVSWDDKGMTWEVYGAVVEVAVLGSAIQKHLEKQVKKQKMHASMPPPPPLNPSATPLTSEAAQGGSGSGKRRAGKRGEQDGRVGRRRRNPFRQLMENMQQPHCCSRAHASE